MKKQLIKLTEGDLHRIIKKSVNRIIREMDENNSIYDSIDASLSKFGDARVSRFYSDESQITLAVNKSIPRKPIIGIMKKFGYEYYTSGANDDYIMITFKQSNNYLDDYAQERMDLEANYDDFPPMRSESIIRRAVKESINRILREDEEPYDWRSDFHLYHDSLNMKPEEGTALHDKYMKGAKEEFGDDELARIREFNRMWKERERRRGIESDSDDDFDDENEIKKALQRANYMKKMGPTKKQTYQEPQTQRSLSDDEFQARLKDLQAQGVLK